MASRENVKINEDNRIIVLSDDIDMNTLFVVQSYILGVSAKDDSEESAKKEYNRKPIKLYINSRGGYVCDTWALIDTILSIKTPVYTYCTGYAYSGAFLLFLTGEKRYGSKHAMWMYHQLSCSVSDYYEGLVQTMDKLKEDQREIENFVWERTTISTEALERVRTQKKTGTLTMKKLLSIRL